MERAEASVQQEERQRQRELAATLRKVDEVVKRAAFMKRVDEAIKDKHAIVGMKTWDVRRALGDPTSTTKTTYTGGLVSETWVYESPTKTETLEFENNILVSMSESR